MQALLKTLLLSVLLGCLGATSLLVAQIPASFRIPILGYVQDDRLHAIRPVVGILGSARIDAPLDLGFQVRDAAFLPDQKHAILAAPHVAELLLVELEHPFRSLRIAGAPSSVSMIRVSRDGTSAGLYDSRSNRLLVVQGLPDAPAISSAVDISFGQSPLKHLAISDDGASALLAFDGETSDTLYSWTKSTGPRFITAASQVSALALLGSDAIIADSEADQVVLIRGFRDQALPVLLADSRDGVSEPVALAASTRNEIYIGIADAVLVVDTTGRFLRRVDCACTVTTMVSLGESAIRLTGALDHPVFVLDAASAPERILFVPALAAPSSGSTP